MSIKKITPKPKNTHTHAHTHTHKRKQKKINTRQAYLVNQKKIKKKKEE